MSTAVHELNDATFEETVRSSDRPVVVEFWAQWCPPCQLLAPILDALAVDYADRIKVYKVNSDEQVGLARRYEVMSVPTVLVFSQGQLQRRMVGARSQARLLEELSDVLMR
jgi:thioredoxin 1